jgi:Fe2+ or Zn2+ uptake regulation protein
MPAAEKRYKNSRQRAAVLAALRGTKAHPTAAWIYEQVKAGIPGVSLGTVYRNLGILRDQGELRVLHVPGPHDRFDGDMSPHYHLLCPLCGRVEDVDLPVRGDLDSAVAAAAGRPVLGHRLDFYCYCGDCAASRPETPAGDAVF